MLHLYILTASPRLLLTILKYKIDSNSKTKNHTKKKPQGYKNSDQNNVQFIFFFEKINSSGKEKLGFKNDYISKTKNRSKEKSYMQKMSARSIPIYPANLATYEES